MGVLTFEHKWFKLTIFAEELSGREWRDLTKIFARSVDEILEAIYTGGIDSVSGEVQAEDLR